MKSPIFSLSCRLTARNFTLTRRTILLGIVAGLSFVATPRAGADPLQQGQSAGNLVTPRANHTANLLLDGRVLLAAGYDGTAETASAEFYNPATNSWRATGSLNQARYFHSSALLPDGRVLVAGGQTTGANDLSSAEIYDPATGRWTFTGNMLAPRAFFSMVLLPNGKVLAAGGNAFGYTTTAELYDPASGTWAATGDLNQSRSNAHLTLLDDGQVLYAGGASAEAELYDPDSGTWSVTGSLSIPRSENIQVLLADGRVLVAGGSRAKSGGNFKILASTEVYDSSTGLWTGTGSLKTARRDFSGTLLSDGKVFAVGGSDANTQTLGSIEEYDPATGKWKLLRESLSMPRAGHTATYLLNGDLIIAGGSAAFMPPIAEAELFVRPR
ncbi:MAG TPA: kelch repeat-containing protein [Chthoniobacterales bacterium]